MASTRVLNASNTTTSPTTAEVPSHPSIEYLHQGDQGAEGWARPVVHLKGFTKGLDFNDPRTSALAAQLVLLAATARTVVWDGDSYDEQSFTQLLPRIAQGGAQVVAYLRECDKERFQRRWAAASATMNGTIKVVLCDSNLSWEDLGIHALQLTRAKTVLCLGGGRVVAGEHARAGNAKFHVFPATQPARPGEDISTRPRGIADVAKTDSSIVLHTPKAQAVTTQMPDDVSVCGATPEAPTSGSVQSTKEGQSCLKCGGTWELPDGERAFFEKKGLCLPKRCRLCRRGPSKSCSSAILFPSEYKFRFEMGGCSRLTPYSCM